MTLYQQFTQAFEPFSTENIDKVFSQVESPDKPFLAHFNLGTSFVVSFCFIVLNVIFCTLFYLNHNLDNVLKFLSICTLFTFISLFYIFFLYLIHKARISYYYVESSHLTRNIKKTYFYNKENRDIIIQSIPLSWNSLSLEQQNQFIKDCEQQCLSNKSIQTIYNMIQQEIWRHRKNTCFTYIQKIYQHSQQFLKTKYKP